MNRSNSTLDRGAFDDLVLQATTAVDAIGAGRVKAEGDPARFDEMMKLMDTFERMFEIVAP